MEKNQPNPVGIWIRASTGAGGIRTPGARRHNGFQDRRFQPLSHCSTTTPLLYKQPSLLQIV